MNAALPRTAGAPARPEGWIAGDESGSPFPASVDALLDSVPLLAGRPRTISSLTGGLTNRNFRIVTDNGDYVARLSSPDSALLAIDRAAEHANSRAAAASGVAPEVLDYLPGRGVLVIAWVDGRTLGPSDVRLESNLARLAQTCRMLHAGPRFANDFNMFDVQLRYLRLVRERGFRLPDRYLDFMAKVAMIREAMAVLPEVSVPCHNDLLAENIIDDGTRLWLIDYEYAGNNDPCFELGNLASESTLSDGQLELLVTHYYGRPLASKLARARLWALMSQYGWTLWASIQDGISTLDFDFWSWGMEKYERAVSTFDSPDFARLLVEVQQPG
ncbi:phosphotransferase [Jatrophihabitans telluris]|uniref:Phosphotransferase n=1 Tax=Jatrophihabitans telluris TaxID=2038343 RepID=A0ABY4R119_9ACTN|nr:choline kinase family protein [Jatrophihabitans telluris]UQX89606.1 phosphotransferase [Jatrophihabitans telluris]